MISRMPASRIGSAIRYARRRKRWTQQQLADAAGVALRTVYDWESGRSYPRNPVAVEEVLGISLDSADEKQLRPIPPELRKLVAETLEDEEVRRQVIGLLEGTLSLPSGDESEAHRRAAG